MASDVTITSAHSGNPISALAFLADDENVLVSAGLDGSLRLWNLQDGSKILGFDTGKEISSLDLCSQGDNIYEVTTGHADGKVRAWTLNLGTKSLDSKSSFSAHSRLVSQVSYSNEKGILASVGNDSKVCVVDSNARKVALCEAVVPEPKLNEKKEFPVSGTALLWTPNARRTLLVGTNVNTILKYQF